MILDRGRDGWQAVEQPDHGHHVGALADALANPPPGSEPFATAARVHDDGWTDYDAAPRWNPDTGLPHTYRSVPTEPYVAVWRDGVKRAGERGAAVELLVSLHGTRFIERRDGAHADAFVREQRSRQTELLDELGLDGSPTNLPARVGEQRSWMRFLDGLSLFALDGWESPWRGEAVGRTFEARRREAGIVVVPWPFDGDRLELEVPCRLLEDRYGSAAELASGWEHAPRTHRTTVFRAP